TRAKCVKVAGMVPMPSALTLAEGVKLVRCVQLLQLANKDSPSGPALSDSLPYGARSFTSHRPTTGFALPHHRRSMWHASPRGVPPLDIDTPRGGPLSYTPEQVPGDPTRGKGARPHASPTTSCLH